ncbi:helix-turn-helix transcriptional regulator [Patescibacteria group bacterium]|nr:helix-turn-helix transcriptional regulator [Patescibacteria group bacterium]
MSDNPSTSLELVAISALVLGNKWTPRLIAHLTTGTARFCQLQDAVGGINPRTLSKRLSDLEKWGVVIKTTFKDNPQRVEYTLTKKGKDLEPIIAQMHAWGEKYATDHRSKKSRKSSHEIK